MQHEQLYAELEAGSKILAGLLSGFTPEEARLKPDPDSWSPLEVVCHLYDEEREDFRPRLDGILHRPDAAWQPIDPAGWVRERNYNQRELPEILRGFLRERERSLHWLRSLATPNWESQCEASFGPIKAGDMLSSWVAHDNLHMRQLVKLRRARVERITAPYDVQYAGKW